MRPRTTSSAIATGSMAASSRADCAPWASGTSLPHQPRLGRMALPNGSSDRSGVNVWTTSLSCARRICAESCDPMLAITMKLEHIGHWIKMRQSLARFSASVSSVHAPSWADFIIATPTFKLSVHTAPNKQSFGAIDRLVFVGLHRLFPRVLDALAIVRPATVIKWHRAGFRLYWRWKSRPRGGRPPVTLEIRRLIREMSIANPLWGAPRIHGELLKLGIAIGQTSVARYMAKRRGPPSQGWKTFLRNHADGIAAIDLFVVPTISFRLLYGLLIMGHGRRQVIWFGVTTHPTAEWIAQQATEACGWESAPHYLIRDWDRVYGEAFKRRVRAMGIRDRPTAPRSP